MVRASGDNHQGVRKTPGYSSERSDLLGPGCQHESQHGHAKWADLGNAAGMNVGLPHATWDDVELFALLVETLIGGEGACGKAREEQGQIKKPIWI